MDKAKLAESLAEQLQEYAEVVGTEEHDPFFDDYILEEVLEMHNALSNDGVEEGRYSEEYSLVTDKPVRLFENITLQRFMSGENVTLKIMAIKSIVPLMGEKIAITFLGQKV